MSENDDPDDFDYRPPPYITELSRKLPGIVAELLVEAMMEAGEYPRDARLYQVRKRQITLFAHEVEPGEVERCIAAAAPWPAWLYQRAQEERHG
jgi:hypothetical protein